MPSAYVFDAFGTLFAVDGVTALAESLAPRQGHVLAQLWRTKQLEYSWQSALMATPARPRPDFDALTAAALDYAIAALLAPVEATGRAQLLDAWRALPPYPDARTTLERLAPRPRVILTNGTRTTADALVKAAGLADVLDGVLSVDAADTYKPDAAVYALAAAHLRLPVHEIGFVSANGWDAGGAKAFGFTTFWINRHGLPVERHAPEPDYVLASLNDLALLAAA